MQGMNQLDKLEALAQRLIEGTFSRLFQTRLRPADLAHHLAVAIESGREGASGGSTNLIPNRYQIILNPADYTALVAHPGSQAQAAKLRQYLLRLAREAGYRFAGPLEVALGQSEAVLPGQVEVKCEQQPDVSEKKPRAETKETLAVNTPPPGQAANRWALKLGERRLPLGQPVVNIGRASDNDIVLSHPTISLYHAQLRWREGRYHLYPPPSANGAAGHRPNGSGPIPHAAVNRQPVGPYPLAPGDKITLGDTDLTVILE